MERFGKKKNFSKFNFKKIFPLVIFLLFFLVMIFTKSRSAFLGFALGAIIYSVLFLIILKNKKKAFYALAGLIFMIVISYLAFGKGAVVQIDKYLYPTKKSDKTELVEPVEPQVQVGTVLDTGGTESGEIRKIVWRGALDVFRHKPVFGTGVETFAYSYYNYRPTEHNMVSEWDFLYNKAHNEWLNLLANSGAIGLMTYLLMMGAYVVYTIRLIRSEGYSIKDKLIASALISGYLALAVSNFFGFSTVVVGYLFFLFPGFLLLLTESIINEDEESVQILDNSRSFIVFALMATSLFMSYKIYLIYLGDKAYASGVTANSQENIHLSLQLLDKALKYQKNEPVYSDEFSKVAANAALSLYAQNQATAAAEISSLAIQVSDRTLEKNNVHLNFYKTRAKILANLGRFDSKLLIASKDVMLKAISLSPTDPKLHFSLGLILNELNQVDESFEYINKAIELKPNYELARYTLGEMYQQLGENDKAIEQYEYILKFISPKNTKVQAQLDKLVK
jgi:O-antigen ligase